MKTIPNLRLLVQRDGRIEVIQDGKRVRRHPIDVRVGLEQGYLELPEESSPGGSGSPASYGDKDLDELKQLYRKAVINGANLPTPRGNWGEKKYAEVLKVADEQVAVKEAERMALVRAQEATVEAAKGA